MIVKNICPYPKQLKSLGNLYLMPGEQHDISTFSQKERDGCIELQECFRKGELICVGVGKEDRGEIDSKLRIARSRVLEKGARQPLMPIESFYVVEPVEAMPSHNKGDYIDQQKPQYRYGEERQETQIVDKPQGIIKQYRGVTYIEPIIASKITPSVPLSSSLSSSIENPTITPERMRQIQSQTCISFCNNGKKCKRRALTGYEYCVTHLPKEQMAQYKAKRKEMFFEN